MPDEGYLMPAYLVVVRPRRPEAATSFPPVAAGSPGTNLSGAAQERRYLLAGEINMEQLERMTHELLLDPVIGEAVTRQLDGSPSPVPAGQHGMQWAVDVAYRAGVTDN